MVGLTLALIPLGCALADQATAPSSVSDQDIRLLRTDLQSTQKQIIAANIPLTDVEAQKFWLLYEQYTAVKARVNDDELSIIKDYAANLGTLTDNQAQTPVSRWAEADRSGYQL